MSSHASLQLVAIAQGLLGVSLTGTLIPAETFSTLAIVSLIAYALMEVFHKHAGLKLTMACINRIQKHLLLQEQSTSETMANRPLTLFTTAEKGPEPQMAGRIFEFSGAYVAPSASAYPILNNMNFSVNQSQITAIIGPVASGKTTLIRAMLGEGTIRGGQVLRKDCRIAYCGQKPWLRNTSIRNNIIGPGSFDPVWYEVALNASALNQDLQQLPSRDMTIVGSNGANLSGGQRHRVVSGHLKLILPLSH